MSQVQSFCQAQKKENSVLVGVEEKRELLKSIENKSKREAEKILVSHFPQPLPAPDQVRTLTPQETEIRMVLPERLLKKLERIRDLRSHKNFNPSYAELIEDMADFMLAQIDPEKKSTSTVKEAQQQETRTVTINSKRITWKKDHGRCSYVSSKTGHRCNETRVIQIDHRTPKALSGSNLPKNLRLLCKNHNLHEAIRTLGRSKMQSYLHPPGRKQILI